jgi:D-amino peptidase
MEGVAGICHGAGGDRSFNSLIPDALDERCEFVVQHEWTEYTEMLEQGCDAALFVGQHARAGAERGVMSHTVSATRWHELRFNGVAVGEVGINAALCGTWGCPVALVTGDDVVCAESTELLGPGAPCTITVELATPDDADKYRNRPGVTLLDARTIECQAPRWWDAWRLIYL